MIFYYLHKPVCISHAEAVDYQTKTKDYQTKAPRFRPFSAKHTGVKHKFN